MPPATPPAIAAVFVFGALVGVGSADWPATVGVGTLGVKDEAAKLCAVVISKAAPVGEFAVAIGTNAWDEVVSENEVAAVTMKLVGLFVLMGRKP